MRVDKAIRGLQGVLAASLLPLIIWAAAAGASVQGAAAPFLRRDRASPASAIFVHSF